MLPGNKISSFRSKLTFLTPDKTAESINDFELGGIDIRDTSQGLVYLWECFYEQGWIVLKNSVNEIKWLQIPNVSKVGLAFDSNMQPVVTYVSGGETFLNWYDSSVQRYITTSYGIDNTSPQISLDDLRPVTSSTSDVIFSYVRDFKVYYRQQRDRYDIEYFVGDVPEGLTLVQIGMTKNYRFQFKIY